MKVYNKKSELADWIRKKLGSPIITVPISSEQLEDVIDDAVDYATVFLGGVGNEEQFVVICPQNCDGAVDRSDPDYLPSLEEGNCTNTLGAISGAPFLYYNAEYQLPRNVVAIKPVLPGSGGSSANTGPGQGATDDDQSILQYYAYGAGIGAVSSLGGTGYAGAGGSALFLGAGAPGYGSMSSFGTRGGSRSGGAGIDLVSFMMGMQYLEMMKQMFTVKLSAQFLEQTRRVRFSPKPGAGIIILPVWARVADKWMYENIFVRRYALALAKLQVGMNLKLYGNMTLPGGVTLNAEEYTSEGKEEKDNLEEDVVNNKFSEPPDFFVG